jgi:hypothetical protein
MTAIAELPQRAEAATDARAMVERLLETDAWKEMDQIDDIVASMPNQVEMPLKHIFTPGLYTRQILIPAGTMATTRIHLTEHPFIISLGRASVWSREAGWVNVAAPYLGVTKPGTRRAIFAYEDTIWTTFHVTDKTTPDEVAREVTYMGGKFSDLGIAAENHAAQKELGIAASAQKELGSAPENKDLPT